MARFIEKLGSSVKEVNLEKGGKWVPQHVYVVYEVLGVEVELEDF